MTERPILFSAPMVRALLAGTKTQTRRILAAARLSHVQIEENDDGKPWPWMYDGERDADHWFSCHLGKPGDRLWVREAWRTVAEMDPIPPRLLTPAHRIWFEADRPHQTGHGRLRASMHMPRRFSRITLEVTGVRVERLQDISDADAIAEGLDVLAGVGAIYGIKGTTNWSDDPRQAYRSLWESINGPDSWAANPWVWVVEFKRVKAAA